MDICVETVCIEKVCITVVGADCVTGCSADVTVSEIDDDCVIGCSANVTVVEEQSDCKCIPERSLVLGTADPDCVAIGDVFQWVVTGCDCTDPCCGPAGWRWKIKPKWATDSDVCLENSLLTIGPIKGYGKIEVELECSPCPDVVCPDCPDCPTCPDCEVCEECEECEECPDDGLTPAQITEICCATAECIHHTMIQASTIIKGGTATVMNPTTMVSGVTAQQQTEINTFVADCTTSMILNGIRVKEGEATITGPEASIGGFTDIQNEQVSSTVAACGASTMNGVGAVK